MSVVSIIRAKESLTYIGGASEEAIRAAEESLSVKFSDEYIEYASVFGAASYYGHELTGVCQSKALSVVEVTNREKGLYEVPVDWYVIENTHMDGVVFWQVSTGEIYMTRPKVQPVKQYNSFAEYLEGEG